MTFCFFAVQFFLSKLWIRPCTDTILLLSMFTTLRGHTKKLQQLPCRENAYTTSDHIMEYLIYPSIPDKFTAGADPGQR